MKLLIAGVSGLLGINLAQEAQIEHKVTGVDRGKLKSAPFNILKLELLESGAVDSALDSARPDWMVNCAALADLDACENNPELARALNIDLPARMAKACKARGIPFVHISTDAVFDGEKDGFYTEEDTPNPLGVYSQTKLAGECAVLSENPEAIVTRVNFYGWSLGGRRSLAEFFFHNLTHNKSMSGFTDVVFCPMLVNDTARILLKMLKKNMSGLYHLVGPQAMSKFQFGVEIARKFSLKESDISPKSILSSTLTAPRSHNLWLSVHKLSTDLGESLPEFSTGLAEFYTQYQQGYPQKIRGYQQF
ncbi:MAG: SDR family oxidoreductase [Chloroflexi bacterium]|nr:SDR family oxidoreductase [Chloroflexota bacterium]